MNTFRSLTKQFEEWRQKERDCRSSPSSTILSKTAIAAESPSENLKPKPCIRKAPPLMLAFAVISLTGVVGYRFYNQPRLGVGTTAPTTIEAPRDGHFEDPRTTEERRKAIRTGIVPILERNSEITAKTEQNLTKIIDRLEQLRQVIGTFPFVEVKILSLGNQKYLRSSSEATWQSVLAAAELKTNSSGSANPQIKGAIAELKKYRQQVPQPEFEALIAKISIARQRYAKVVATSFESDHIKLNAETIAALMNLSDRTWQNTKLVLVQTSHRMLVQGIPQGVPPEILAEAVGMNLERSVTKPALGAATQLLLKVLQPNLTINREETKHRAEQAALAVEPVKIEIKKGDVIVKAGETITQEDFVILDNFGLSRRGISWKGLGATALLVSTSIGLFCLVVRQVQRPIRRRDVLLLCLLSLSAPLMSIMHPRYNSLPAIGLLASSFYGPTVAIAHVTLMGGLTTFAVGADSWEYLLTGTAGGLVAAFIAGKLRARDELSLLGVGVGLTQGGTYFIVNLILSASAGTIWYVILPGAITYGLLGVAWSIVALGISPYLEQLFDLITPLRLIELSSPNRPLLKRLATEAPGTFQHTLFVASLAEAAARELHCNVELVRTGTLYHDIGKMHDPLGFIENQMGGPNKHDEIDDPWLSVEIIKKHVSEGLVMARKYKLPKAVQDFIPEHQGTLLIAYFYYQAKQQAEQEGKPPILESEFRYVGPTPQSRETGIVMLADACEAALRSLKDVTPESALATINKIFRARWRDNQLNESGIKYEELPIIAEVFVRVWQQVNHQRIAYPKAALEPQMPKQSVV